jgi:predicted RecB family nuclease
MPLHFIFEHPSMPTDDDRRARLSKSRFMAGVQCLKRLYLQVRQPELAAAPDEAALATLRQGQEVGELARTAFPDGVLVKASQTRLSDALDRTQQLLADTSVQAVFEGTFNQDSVLVRTDILDRGAQGKWRLIEVKSSTKVKDHHRYDVGIQQYVLSHAGLTTTPCLMHLNRDYVYNGREYEPGKLFTIEEMEPEVGKLIEELPGLVRLQRLILSQSDQPDIEPGPQCTDPVQCEFFDYCNKPLPDDHVSLLPGIKATRVNQLAAMGITSIHEIPEDFPLSQRQRRACHCIQTQTPFFGKGLHEAIGQLKYPLFFMDFETLNPAIPRFAGMRPYDPIPFQWSIHMRSTPGGQAERYEFLAQDSSDPRLPFLTSLLEVIGQEGHVIVYNRGFESQRLAELAHWLPDHADQIERARARLWDLLDVVRKNVYHPDFRGSFSLKQVLPVLIPDMTYEGMEVSEGEQAGLAWDKMVRGQVSEEDKQRLRNALLEYCSQDTFAMVRLLDFLTATSSGGV